MLPSALTRALHARLFRPFSTGFISKNSFIKSEEITESPEPPRRKGRTPKIDPKTQTLLPPNKLQALVSLYHQSDDFVTPENLLQRIDAAFIHDIHDQYQSIDRIRHEQYDIVLQQQRSAPKTSPWDTSFVEPAFDSLNSRFWSDTIAGREKEVVDALYGVESPKPNARPQPGYGTLVEARELKQKQAAFVDDVEDSLKLRD